MDQVRGAVHSICDSHAAPGLAGAIRKTGGKQEEHGENPEDRADMVRYRGSAEFWMVAA